MSLNEGWILIINAPVACFESTARRVFHSGRCLSGDKARWRKLEIFEELLDFSAEIISIFAIAYSGHSYVSKNNNAIKSNADINTYFIQEAIYNLKNK